MKKFLLLVIVLVSAHNYNANAEEIVESNKASDVKSANIKNWQEKPIKVNNKIIVIPTDDVAKLWRWKRVASLLPNEKNHFESSNYIPTNSENKNTINSNNNVKNNIEDEFANNGLIGNGNSDNEGMHPTSEKNTYHPHLNFLEKIIYLNSNK